MRESDDRLSYVRWKTDTGDDEVLSLSSKKFETRETKSELWEIKKDGWQFRYNDL